jgi:hypothetical protein
MPKGPKGEKRPADVIGAASWSGRIATGEIEEGESGQGPGCGFAWPQGRKGARGWAERQEAERDRQEGR